MLFLISEELKRISKSNVEYVCDLINEKNVEKVLEVYK